MVSAGEKVGFELGPVSATTDLVTNEAVEILLMKKTDQIEDADKVAIEDRGSRKTPAIKGSAPSSNCWT